MTTHPAVRVRFINHACISIETPRFSLLTDPWFSGSVFHDSWRLIRETDPAALDLSTLRYLWISHEHPDHFHFPTLRALRSKVAGPLTVYFQELSDKSVRDALLKLGYSVVELAEGVPREVEPGVTLTCFRAEGGDSALLADVHNTLIADTNDCGLTDRRLARIRDACGGRSIDVLLTQFGLAGYYANAEDTLGFARAREFHIGQLRRYVSALKPKVVVPFASYVAFCRPSNQHLNTAQVRLRDLVTTPPPAGEFLVPRPGDEVWPPPSDCRAATTEGLEFWEDAFASAGARPLLPDPTGDPAEIERLGAQFVTELRRGYFRRRLADSTIVYLTDLKRAAVFDWKARIFQLEPADAPPPGTVGELGSGDFLFMLKAPWGADTLNVTAAFHVLDKDHWAWLVWTKNALYSVRKAPRRARFKNRLWLTAARIAGWAGVDLTDGRAWPWRVWDRLRDRPKQ